MVTIRTLLFAEMKKQKDTSSLVRINSILDLDFVWDEPGRATDWDQRKFTIWTERRIYFLVDTANPHCESISRDPSEERFSVSS